jgi:signal transduction histidine kinase
MDFNILKKIGETEQEVVFIYHVPARRFEYLNQLAAWIWERPLEWIVEEPFNLIQTIHSEDLAGLEFAFNSLQNGSRQWYGEIRILRPKEGFKTINLKVYAIRQNRDDLYFAGFAEDISGQKSHEAYLLEFGNKKNTALEILAHELAGPLSIARTIANTLEQENLHQNNGQTAEYARIIQQVCENNLKLISNILSEEHLKSPLVKLKKELVNVVKLTRMVLAPYQAAETSQQQIEVVANTGKIIAGVDKIKFSQIINNLASNAIKFTPANGRIVFSFTDTGPDVLLKVTDTGIGIPENLQPFMFTHHSRASRPGLKGEPSRGIGMYISKMLVDMHNGKIWFESAENAGTTFYILLPKAGA